MNDGFLHKYFLNNSYKRLNKCLHFFDIYERHLARFRDISPVMIEIGVMGGGSLSMWKEYFGSGSRIIGIDINPECKVHEDDGIDIFIGNQNDSAVIDAIFSKYPRIDIVLDDGSHMMQDIISSFELFYNRMHSNGVYMVEDTCTSYRDEFGGGVGRDGSFMEFVKQKLDEINAAHTRGVLPVMDFARFTDCIACYNNIVVFERRRQSQTQDIITQGM